MRLTSLSCSAALLQDDGPVAAINAYMNGFHFVNGNRQEQLEAHHHCATLNEDVRQCVIFDGNGRDATRSSRASSTSSAGACSSSSRSRSASSGTATPTR